MREILFRGKRTDGGGWVHGSYVECKRSWHKLHPHKAWIVTDARSNGGWFAVVGRIPVINETVGQYTGLNDKDGKPIFDGDITRLVLDNGEVRHFTVKIETLERMIVTTYPGFEPATAAVQITGVIFDWHGHKLLPCVDGNGVSDVSKMEVVGNIYDNPELMEVKENA